MSKRVQWTAERGRVKQSSTKTLLIVFAVLTAIVLAVVSIMLWKARVEVEKPEPKPSTTVSAQDTNQPDKIEGRYLFNGTAVFARAVERAAGSDLTQPFQNMASFQPEQYDAMTLDWECPSTDEVIPYETQVAQLLFNCHVKWLPEVAKYFSIVSLTNNHSGDLGAEAFIETQTNLEKAGIQSYGNYDPSEKDDVCEIIALPVRVKGPGGREEKGELPMAFCSWHYFFRTPNPGEIEVMEEYAKVMPVFGFMHAGAEYYPKAGPDQEAIARRIIDLGAEFVIGNSPHWVQNSEVYKGKPIFYSTGNFFFDQIDYETMRGLSIDVSMEVPYSDNVKQWLKLGKECKPLADSCLEKIQQQGLKKYNLKLSYDVVGSSGGARRITTRANETLQNAIEERVNWAETQRQLGQPTAQ